VAVIRREGACRPTAGPPGTDDPIKASVGAVGPNFPADVKLIQSILNALSPLEVGPVEMLIEDGSIGPKTRLAITERAGKGVRTHSWETGLLRHDG
jgi:hypothetical protein